MITDPRGRRLGDDPLGHATYDEIPSAYYDAGGLEDDETGEQEEDPPKMIFIQDPVAGNYELTIAGARAGKYACQFAGQNDKGTQEHAELKDVVIGADEVQVYLLRFPRQGESQIQVKRK